MDYTTLINDMTKYMNYTKSIQKAMSSFNYNNQIQRMMESLNQLKTSQNSLAAINAENSIQLMMKSMDYSNSIQKVISSLNYNDSIRKMMESIHHTASIQNTLGSINAEKSIQRMMKSMDYMNSIQDAISSLKYNTSIQKMMGSMNYVRALNNFSKSQTISSSFQTVGAFLVRPNILKQIIESNKSWEDIAADQVEIAQEEISQFFTPLSKAKDAKVFISAFLKIPSVIQAVIIFFFLQIFLPQLNNISSNILTPYVEEIIGTSDRTDKEIVKEIKKIPASYIGIDISKLRFITGSNVRLRQKPSTTSQIIDELDIGQIVEVLNKKKNWIQVKVIYEEGHLVGWVFTRYTAKFKK